MSHEKAIAAALIAAALEVSFAAGCRVTMLSARLVSSSNSSRLHPAYIISYRYGPLWFNELYD